MPLTDYKLRTLQVEITTTCNFECKFCLHANGGLPQNEMPLTAFKTIAKNLFPSIEHLILYGVGEPLTHPEFLDILAISRDYLPEEAKIEFTTNGSLLTPDMLNSILFYGIDRIIVSLDSPFIQKLAELREGATEEIFDNLKSLVKAYKEGKIPYIAIETLISKQNLYDLPFLVKFCSGMGIPRILISHLLPYTPNMELNSLYIPISERAFQIMDEIGQMGWDVLDQLILTPRYHEIIDTKRHSQIQKMFKLIEQGRSEDIEFDLRKISWVQRKKQTLMETKSVFERAGRIAEKNHIFIDLPPIFAESDKRECPFALRNALFIDFNGNIMLCYNFGHSHTLYINQHRRQVNYFEIGKINEKTNGTISGKTNEKTNENLIKNDPLANFIDDYPGFIKFQSVLNQISEKVPYCGDCIYSTQNCYYVSDNTGDCYGNQPGCNECPYSTGFVKCLFDFE